MVSREGTQLRQLTNDGAPKRDVIFSGPEDRLLYLARIDGRWKLMELPDEQSAPPLQMATGENWMSLRAAPDGSVFGQREGEQQIRRIGGVAQPGGAEQVDEATQADVVDLVQVRETDVWAVGPEGVYVRRRSRLQPSTVWFFPWHQPGRKITDLPLAYGNLAVSPTGAVIFTQGTTSNIDLGMVELHPEG
jgi:hypothetical protein